MTRDSTGSAKSLLRRAMRQARARLDVDERRVSSQEICARVLQLLSVSPFSALAEDSAPRLDLARTRRSAIAVYLASETEVCVDAVVRELLSRGARVAAPVVMSKDNGLSFFTLRALNSVRAGVFGVREPAVMPGEMALPLHEIQIVLVPGVAFGRDGSRLGQGGGFYDRILAQTRESGALAIGVCFDCQIVEQVPCRAHDEKVAWVVSEKQVLQIGSAQPKRLTMRTSSS